MKGDESIQVIGMTKSYKQQQVLKGVDFEVEEGSILPLLGSNGPGKTTVVKNLTTLLKLDSGTASVNGFDVASAPEHVKQAISLTGQFAAVDDIGHHHLGHHHADCDDAAVRLCIRRCHSNRNG